MIWVIGDIHGMFDPLKRLMLMLQRQHYSKHAQDHPEIRIEKLIFLGDYVDCGPSSKEVIDYIMELPFEKVFLLGNHDDLLLQFVENSDMVQQYGNIWFRGSGGQRTVSSFFPKVNYSDHEEKMKREDFPLGQVYLDFFKNLQVTHIEKMGKFNLAFVHGLFNHKFPIDEQLAIKTYDDFHSWRKQNQVWIEDTLIWNRLEPETRFGDYILIHGHIPTPKLKHVWKNLHSYDPALEMPFLKFEDKSENKDDVEFYGYGYRHGYTAEIDQLIAINADTGAVYGNRLTAIGLWEEGLEDSEIRVCQVSVGKGYRLANDFHSYSINFSGF